MPLEGLCFREKEAGAKAHRAERIVGGTMKKTMEQIILEGQVAKCRSLEELLCAVGADAADGGRSGRKDLLSGTGSEKFSY